MDRQSALDVLRMLRTALEARGVAHAGLFGSVARGSATSTSDIDVILTPMDGRRLDLIDLGGLQSLLEEHFSGAQIDLLVEPVRSPALRLKIAQDRAHAF